MIAPRRMANLRLAFLVALPLLGACSAPSEEPMFGSISPTETTMAIEQAARQKDLTKVDDLVSELDSSDPAIRLVAIAALRDLTGQDLGYNPSDKESDRMAAIDRWVAWIRAEREAGRLPSEPFRGASPRQMGPNG